MTYHLTITEDQNHQFFQKYDSLSATQKKIFQRMVWYTKKYPNAHPCQKTIAEGIGIKCSRKHVNRSIALFKKWGWVSLISRGRKMAKTILIPEILKQIDVVKRQYFKRTEVTSKVTHSYSINKSTTGRGKAGILQIAEWLLKLDIPLDQKLKLSLVPENIFHETREICNNKAKNGFSPKNAIKYFVGTALNLAIKRGYRLEWKKYYNTLAA